VNGEVILTFGLGFTLGLTLRTHPDPRNRFAIVVSRPMAIIYNVIMPAIYFCQTFMSTSTCFTVCSEESTATSDRFGVRTDLPPSDQL
jgi:hypothetical protein